MKTAIRLDRAPRVHTTPTDRVDYAEATFLAQLAKLVEHSKKAERAVPNSPDRQNFEDLARADWAAIVANYKARTVTR